MTQTIQFNFPTIVRYGKGCIFELETFLQQKGFQNPLVVTDRDIIKLEIFEKLQRAIGKVNYSVYSETHGNPLVSHVEQGKNVYLANKADAIIAFGGGAAIDVAKCIAMLVSHPGNLLDYEDIPTGKPIDDSVLPYIIAIPTTAGTGSEVGRSGVVSDDRTKIKKIIFSPGLLPGRVYLDFRFFVSTSIR